MIKKYTHLLITGIAILIVMPLSAQKKQVGYYGELLRNGMFTAYDTGVYTYDNKGLLATETNQYYSGEKGKWVDYFKAEFTYNTNGDRDYYEWSLHNGTEWKLLYHYSYLYQSDKKLETIFELRLVNGNWRNYSKEEYTYNADGKKDTVTTSSIDSLGNPTLDYRNIYTYNANGGYDTETTEYWDKPSSSWVMYLRTNYEYDNLNREYILTTEVYGNSKWTKAYSYTYTYDGDGLLRKWDKFDYDADTVTQRGYNIYEFDGPLAARATSKTSSAIVFPNPATTNATFSWEDNQNTTLEIRDITGKLVAVETIQGNTCTLNTSAYTNGIYVYTLLNNTTGTTAVGKLIVNK